jgi:CHRD domain-containing protein
MKRSIGLALGLSLGFLLAASATAQTSTYTAFLTGATETPNPADPDGVGFVVLTIDQGAGTITFTAFGEGINFPATGSHIHRGAAGVTGPVIIPFNLPFANGISQGIVQGVNAGLLAEVVANPPGYYFNIHNADFPGGAIRGQLRAAPGTFAPTVIYLPVTLKAIGARGENFVEHVRILNRANTAANVIVDFFASNAGGLGGPTATKAMVVAAGQQLVLNDILGSTFNTSGIGALRITADRDVIAEGIILNDKRAAGTGTFGFFIHGLAIEAVCRNGTLPVLSQASAADIAAGIGFRTNIGYFNPNSFPVNVTFNARKTSDGSSLGSIAVVVPGFSHAQFPVFSLINTVAVGDQKQDDFYVSYTVSAGTLFVYAAVGDDFTGDSYYTAGACPP